MTEPSIDPRGLEHFEPIAGRSGRVDVSESSMADGPHIWLTVTDDEERTTTAQLNREQAERLVGQIRRLFAGHHLTDRAMGEETR